MCRNLDEKKSEAFAFKQQMQVDVVVVYQMQVDVVVVYQMQVDVVVVYQMQVDIVVVYQMQIAGRYVCSRFTQTKRSLTCLFHTQIIYR